MDVVEVAQAEQGCEGAAGQHPESQVIPNRQAFPYYATEATRKERESNEETAQHTANS